jgi:hypothetical protein
MLEFSSNKTSLKSAVSATRECGKYDCWYPYRSFGSEDFTSPDPKNSTVGFANGQFGRR